MSWWASGTPLRKLQEHWLLTPGLQAVAKPRRSLSTVHMLIGPAMKRIVVVVELFIDEEDS